jgi:cyclic beta-1,2-glucan synthetase
MDPCIPSDWPGFELVYRYGSTRYEITVANPKRVSRGVALVESDGNVSTEGRMVFPLADDGAIHRINITLG